MEKHRMPAGITSAEQGRDHQDELIFLDEAEGYAPPSKALKAWRVMIVDDDEDVHSTTTFALGNVDMQHRALEFVHAYSAAQAREMLRREQDIAVILLDVVMEQEDAGLHLVRHIRETLKLSEVRIILRTGQPGYAPEIEAIRHYDINDYKTKSELTRIKLYTTVAAAIRSYDQIRTISASRRGLNRVVQASTELMALHGVRDFAAGVLEQIASLLDVPADGVLCACERQDGVCAELVVKAATGRFAGLETSILDGALAVNAGPEPDAALAVQAMQAALAQRDHVYGDQWMALCLGGKVGRNFAAFIPTPRPLDETERRLLQVFCSNVAVGLDNVELVSHLHTAAFYDQLSTLPNRTRLVEILDATLAGPARAHSVLSLVDLDHFAETNDALGHQFGDLLLVAVARRLQAHLGQQLTVARLGADTFGVLGAADQVNPTAILELFTRPFSIDGQDVQVSATLGLVRLAEHESSGADALKDADIALKRAKSRQRTGHFYFSRSMGVDIRERVRMMHSLRRAFGRKELFLVYQPQIDLCSRRTVGVEALLRWQTPDGNFVSPDRFIHIAEYSGLIVELGEWVLRTACRELVALRNCGHRDITMSVNVSQIQFRHPRFLDVLRSALEDTQAPPEFIELEITESMAMEEPELLIEMLLRVKQTGVAIAIDDFGTGFSSLSYLQRLQIDRLKIDRSFVSEITSSLRGSSIAEMVVQLGRNLGLAVIAEGVEDERQAQILQALGCPIAQGFLFARPMPASALANWLDEAHATGTGLSNAPRIAPPVHGRA
jgi:diguanylate cyclase (GGDEF)-like protein